MARFYYLTPVLGGPGAPRYPVTEERQLVGRSEAAHIALLEPTVSREHAAVYLLDGQVKLDDLDSKHGTYVNSKRVAEKVLKVGDIIVFGLSLVLRLEESSSPIPAPPALASRADATVSLVETPRRRRQTHRSGEQATITRVAPAPSQGELDRMREATVRARKLATVGALSAAALPRAFRVLSELLDQLRRGGQPAVDELENVVQDLGQLVDDCHLARPQLEPVSLFDVVRRAVAEAMPEANRRDVDLLLGVPAEVDVLTDASRLLSALLQVLRNATEASPRGSAVEVGGGADERWAVLSIVDAGPGIGADVLERVFDPFVTLKDDWQTLGLGLFEARETIVTLGGNLSLESQHGRGTTVTIHLPRA